MNQLGQKTITSLEVAEMVNKNHADLMRDIRRYTEQLGESNIAFTDFFTENTYLNSQNKELPCYLVTKKGCEFIGNKLTGIKGTEFTAKYINRFNDMEAAITRPLSQEQIMRIQLGMLDDVSDRVMKLENNMTIDYGQARDLKQLGASRIVDFLGGKKSPAYKELSKTVFAELWHDYKEFFHINSYSNTPVVKYRESLDYVTNWVPSVNTRIKIKEVNSQMCFA